MTNLTDRMARIAWITHRDRQLAQLGMKPSEYAADIPIPDWAYTLADAVIRELSLATACESGCVWQIPNRFEDMTPRQRELLKRSES